ncbi:sushi, von Willebrand factor type A, EGF and pentraxin domain-containing protein 1-like [Mya arenaria]|uniref:sushi, von Willebrand factor type A, EGF and pentraxin domain-containing protein 1-like n=1 Tax=Mya arenaria TaxID=6604 RepID=UPI0022E48EFD|nr:sushi, von Willebrand factor type A, EGF and pentraxin domain-containing protein 1-like [Mya arenaria]
MFDHENTMYTSSAERWQAWTTCQISCLEFVLSKHPSRNVNHTYETVSTPDESACFLACFDIPYCRTFRYSSGTCYIYTCGDDCVTSYLISGSFDIYHRTCTQECPVITNTTEYTVKMSGFSPGDTLETTCNSGYEHSSGDVIRTCLADYAWDGLTAVCSPVYCDKPPTIANASYTLSSGTTVAESSVSYTWQSTVEYACNDGFTLNGDPMMECSAGGDWIGSVDNGSEPFPSAAKFIVQR